jgi:hypothetical protein
MSVPSLPPGSPPSRFRWKVPVIVGVVGVIAVIAGLATIPISHRFSDGFNATHEFGGVTLVAPAGSRVALNWSASGGPASISVYNGNGQVLYASNAPTGAFSFTAVTASDGFEANSTSSAFIFLAWEYSSPIL